MFATMTGMHFTDILPDATFNGVEIIWIAIVVGLAWLANFAFDKAEETEYAAEPAPETGVIAVDDLFRGELAFSKEVGSARGH